jgi:hypothetical protein
LPVDHERPRHDARTLHAALEAGLHGDDLRELFTDDATTIEHPNPIKPEGSIATVDAMLAPSTAGSSLLASQRFDVHDAREIGDLAILRLTWTGVVAADLGPLQRRPGDHRAPLGRPSQLGSSHH